MATGDIYRLTRIVEIDGQTCVNVLHFNDSDGTSETPEEDLLDAWDPIAGVLVSPEDSYQGLQRGFTTYTQVSLSAQRVLPTEGEIVTRAFNRGKSAATDSGLPTFAQIKFLMTTDLNSRSGRGGFYMSGIAEGSTNGNSIDAAFPAAIDGFISAFTQVFTASGAEFSGFVVGVLSRLLLEFNTMTSVSYATTLGTMVSRRVGHGV